MEFIASLVSSSCASICTHPIDIIKTQFQVTRLRKKRTQTKVTTLIRNLYKQKGFRGFFNGVASNLLTYPIFWAVFFQTKKMLPTTSDNKYADKFTQYLAASGIGSIIANPLFVLKTRFQTLNLKRPVDAHKSYAHLVQKIYRNEGLRGFYKGLTFSLINNTKITIQFPLYDTLIEQGYGVLYAALISKTVSTTIFYPFDLFRIIQRNSPKKLKILGIAKKVYSTHGLRGFYKGVMLYNLTSTPNFVIMMCLKDAIVFISNQS